MSAKSTDSPFYKSSINKDCDHCICHLPTEAIPEGHYDVKCEHCKPKEIKCSCFCHYRESGWIRWEENGKPKVKNKCIHCTPPSITSDWEKDFKKRFTFKGTGKRKPYVKGYLYWDRAGIGTPDFVMQFIKEQLTKARLEGIEEGKKEILKCPNLWCMVCQTVKGTEEALK